MFTFVNMDIKSRILEIMEKSGLTPSEFADKIEVQRSAISHITSGRNNPSLDFVIKIKTAFPEVDTEWLIFGGEKKENQKEENLSLLREQKPETPTLFDTEELESEEESEYGKRKEKFKSNENPNRIILFFPDGTFQSFLPKDN